MVDHYSLLYVHGRLRLRTSSFEPGAMIGVLAMHVAVGRIELVATKPIGELADKRS